MPFEYLFLF